MNPTTKRKIYQKVRKLPEEQFWEWFNVKLTDAYMVCHKEWEQAAFIVLPPKQQRELREKFKTIRGEWDNIDTVTVEHTVEGQILTLLEDLLDMINTGKEIPDLQTRILELRADIQRDLL